MHEDFPPPDGPTSATTWPTNQLCSLLHINRITWLHNKAQIVHNWDIWTSWVAEKFISLKLARYLT